MGRQPTIITSLTMFIRKAFQWGLVALLSVQRPVHADTPVNFSHEIRPILSENCFSCHGPDEKGRKAGLRLDDELAAKENNDGSVAIVPGKLQASALIQRVESTDADEVMPPPDSHRKLTPQQVALLKRWIVQGAAWGNHWSFEPVMSEPIPANGEPHPIDAFIRARLVQEGIAPTARASKETLIRRVTLDLTGLPPTPDEVAAFLGDTSDQAFERVIDRLFTSPHYGERMAVDWLDAARFADTQGYQVDRDQDMHPWRDWVIAAFNQNMPFDQFTIEQLAGDLLPQPTMDQKIATGFHRNHMVNQEGGIIPAEFIAEYTADRVETTASVWLGQTFNCTRCHDHKFDPFTQKDFYSLKAFFNNVGEQGEGAQDTITLPSPEIDHRLNPLLEEVSALQDKLGKQNITDDVVRAWAERLVKHRLEWHPFEIDKLAAPQGSPKVASDARGFDLSLVNRETKPIVVTVKVPHGKAITALRLECSTEDDSARINLARVFAQQGPKKKLDMMGAIEGMSLKATDAERVFNAARKKAVTLQPGPNKPAEAMVWQLLVPLEATAKSDALDISIAVASANRETQWRLLYSVDPADQLVAESTLALAEKEPESLTRAERGILKRDYQLALAESKEIRNKIDDLNDRIAAIRKQQLAAIVMREAAKPKDTFILMRGVYDQPGEKVVAATPAILPPLPKDAPNNRLGLAQWLVSAENPLTARVTVNRIWQSIFGTGLVRTSEDFGSQGQPPSHPELLDWLAYEFMRSGWDIQHMLRLILTSATYQQSSRVTPALLVVDPDNRLLARGPRFRLHAEFVRDQALAASGLLSPKIGGKSAKPYHPPGLYELVTAGSTTNVYVEDKDEGLHRRSLYTYWKRSVPHPAMIAFDAPGREVCSLRRPRSNTPLQALNLMNDPAYVEAARHLALRMLRAGPDISSQIQFGYRTLLARQATAAELAVLTRAYERTRADFSADPSATMGFLNTGRTMDDAAIEKGAIDSSTVAAMTSIASTMLCLDETVTKE